MSVTDRPGTMPREVLSEQQCNIEFVKTVEKYPCLYNFLLPTYTRKDISDKAWEKVAEASNMTPSACRERWRNLRAVFTRTIKQTVAGTKKKPYYLSDDMQFVVPFLQPTNMSEANKQKMQIIEKTRSEPQKKETGPPPLEIELDEIKVESVDEDTDQEWSTDANNSRKRPKEVEESFQNPSKRPYPVLQSVMSVSDNSDPVASFVNSLMPELREMNSAQFKCFKRRVLILIDNITTEIPNTHKESEYIT